MGKLDLMVPKLRHGSFFPTDLLERRSRTDRALAAAVAEMRVTGTSRRWNGMAFPYLFLDATYVKCRVNGHVSSRAFVTAIGVGDDGDGRRRASAVMAAVFAEKDPVMVVALYHRAIDELEAFCPRAARVLEDAEADALTYLSFPGAHRIKVRTNNVQERMNCELKRRTKVVQAFPSAGSVMRLLGGIIGEINVDWEASSRFMSEESLRPLVDGRRVEDRLGEAA